MIPWVYEGQPWAKVAELSPLLTEALEENDPVAQSIITRAAEGLWVTCQRVTSSQNSVEALVHRLELTTESFTLVLVGGNLTAEKSRLTLLMRQKISQHFPKAEIVFPSMEMAVASALIAFKN